MQKILTLSPEDVLTFENNSSGVYNSTLKLQNNTNRSVCFKIKTNSPSKYIVRPSIGSVPPLNAVEVTIIMQEKSIQVDKDQFLVEALLTILETDATQEQIRDVFKNSDTKNMQKNKIGVAISNPILVTRRGTIYQKAEEIVKDDTIEELDVEIKEFEKKITRQREEASKLKNKHDQIKKQIEQNKNPSEKAVNDPLAGFTSLHLLLVFVAGIVSGLVSLFS